jgi:hypothetical protein
MVALVFTHGAAIVYAVIGGLLLGAVASELRERGRNR